jgi:hypothetical protein
LPNRPQTRANAGVWQVDGKNDGKNPRGSYDPPENQQLRSLVDDRVEMTFEIYRRDALQADGKRVATGSGLSTLRPSLSIEG